MKFFNTGDKGQNIINWIAALVFVLGAIFGFRSLYSFRSQIVGQVYHVNTTLSATSPIFRIEGQDQAQELGQMNYYMVFGSGNFYGKALAFSSKAQAEKVSLNNQLFRRYAEGGQSGMKYQVKKNRLELKQPNGAYLTMTPQNRTSDGFTVKKKLSGAGQSQAVQYIFQQTYTRMK